MTFRKTAEPSQVTDAKDGLTPSQRVLRFPVIWIFEKQRCK